MRYTSIGGGKVDGAPNDEFQKRSYCEGWQPSFSYTIPPIHSPKQYHHATIYFTATMKRLTSHESLTFSQILEEPMASTCASRITDSASTAIASRGQGIRGGKRWRRSITADLSNSKRNGHDFRAGQIKSNTRTPSSWTNNLDFSSSFDILPQWRSVYPL
ncbi:hypothetical protein BJV77DRAFT_964182 [Russula vinacea]|nr:hypothetical protein BJV77DRAFT_964182 [Russula vinacea]